MDYKKRTVRAAGWAFMSKLLSQILSFGVGIVLARLLVPDDFGLIAMAVFFTGIASLMIDVGFGHALIQKQDATDIHFYSIFWLNLFLSLTIGLIIFVSAGAIADFYGKQELLRIVELLSVVFIFSAFGFIPRLILSKSLNFKYLSTAELVGMIVSGVVAIILANNGFGYWSLVFHILGQHFIIMLLLILVTRWLPRLKFDAHAVRELFGFSFYIFMTRLLQYTAGSIDKMLLGKYVGSYSTGIYDKAQSLMLTPLAAISDSIGSVMFPSMSLIQNDRNRIKDVYIRTTRSIALITFPMMTGMFVVSESFVYSILGEKWSDIIPALKIFCVAGMFSSLATVVPAIYQSLGESRLQFKVNLISQPLRIVAVIVGLNWGVIGVIYAFTIAIILTKTLTIGIAINLVGLGMLHLFRSVFPIFITAVLMGIIVHFVGSVCITYNYMTAFVVQVIAGMAFYWAILIASKNTAYYDLVAVIKKDILNKK